ncbi:unnamed protein product, partial [Heterotrigona itama]
RSVLFPCRSNAVTEAKDGTVKGIKSIGNREENLKKVKVTL